MSKEIWLKLLRSREAYCYFKPNRNVHESGYRCFEVGYCTLDEDGTRTDERLVLNTYCDHIDLGMMEHFQGNPIVANMDLLRDGYIRIWNRNKRVVWWGSLDWTTSSTSLSWLDKINEES